MNPNSNNTNNFQPEHFPPMNTTTAELALDIISLAMEDLAKEVRSKDKEIKKKDEEIAQLKALLKRYL